MGPMSDIDRPAALTDFLRKPTLHGDKVTLRPPSVDDVPALMPMFRDPEVARFTGSHQSPDEERARAWYATRGEQDDRLDLAVVARATGSVVGEVVLNGWDAGNESCGFRTCFVPTALGQGLGTEAIRLIVGYGFEQLRLHRISLEVFTFNPRARGSYEKVGFVREGVMRDALLWEGERVDAELMAILAPEWHVHRGFPSAVASA